MRNRTISNSGACTIIERSQVGSILQEQGLQKTGCTDVTCAVEAGRLLSARKILIGSVMKIGSTIIISGRIVDAGKGIGNLAANEVAVNEEGLFEAARKFARRIAGE